MSEKEFNDEQNKKVSGGYRIGRTDDNTDSNGITKEKYLQAGVKWTPKKFGRDTYEYVGNNSQYRGRVYTQKDAEELLKAHFGPNWKDAKTMDWSKVYLIWGG